MKNIFLLGSLILICLQINAQQNNSFACGLENFIAAARDKDPDYDKKMVEQEKLRSQWKNKDHKTTANVLTIPVVVHVVWNTITDSISIAQVASQIAVLNTDYMRLNADTSNTPSAFLPISANPKIQFCLAQTDPQGNLTNGITYKKTAKTSFAVASGDTSIWHTVKGGYDGWDPSNYLNIWVADFGPLGGAGFWPGAAFKGYREGVIVNHTFFGTTGSAIAPFNLGRTATHEIGHFLDLHHLWGDGGNNSSCTATDFCGDTPAQAAASPTICPTFPKTDACTNSAPGLNFMNFMDYPQDACRNMFTVDQVARMRACLEGGPRSSLLTSTVCSVASGINEKLKTNTISIFPNPASQTIHVANISELSNIKLYDALGKIALELKAEQDLSIDVSSLAKGIYTLAIENKTGNVFRKVILAK